jgi:hypothetical protein
MTDKKVVAKQEIQGDKEIQAKTVGKIQFEVEIDTSTAEDLLKIIEQQERDLANLGEEVAHLKLENEKLIEHVETEVMKPLESTTPTTDLRTTMLMAMLCHVRPIHARPDAQKALEAVDVILDAWGMK